MNGKISGNYLKTKETKIVGDAFYELAFREKSFYKNQKWLFSRKIMDDNFTFYENPKLSSNFDEVSKVDHIIEVGIPIYYISIDSSGKLG